MESNFPRLKTWVQRFAVFAASFGLFLWAFAYSIAPIPRTRLDAPGPQASIGFSPNGKYFVTADILIPDRPFKKCKMPLRIWDGRAGTCLATLDSDQRQSVHSVVGKIPHTDGTLPIVTSIYFAHFSPNGEMLGIATSNNLFEVIRLHSLKPCFSMETDVLRSTFSFSPDSTSLIVENQSQIREYALSEKLQRIEWDRDHETAIRGFSGAWSNKPVVIPTKILIDPEWMHEYTKCGRFVLVHNCTTAAQTDRSIILYDRTTKKCRTLALKNSDQITISLDGKTLFHHSGINIAKYDLGEGFAESRLPIEGLPVLRDYRTTACRFLSSEISVYETAQFWNFNWLEESLGRLTKWRIEQSAVARSSEFEGYLCDKTTDGAQLVMLNRQADKSSKKLRLAHIDVTSKREITLDSDLELREFFHAQFAPNARQIFVTNWGKPRPLDVSQSATNRFLAAVSDYAHLDTSKWRIEPSKSWTDIYGVANGTKTVTIPDEYFVSASPDGQTFATQNSRYEIRFWDLPLRRNWPLASAFALFPAVTTSIVVTIAFRVLSRRRKQNSIEAAQKDCKTQD